MFELVCSVCKQKVSVIYRISQQDVCNGCYKKIFKDANPVKISQYVDSVLDKANKENARKQEQIDNLTAIANDYHNICHNYETHCDMQEANHLKDLKDIREVVNMYSKGIGLHIYNSSIKPILNHIDYKINKLKGEQNEH